MAVSTDEIKGRYPLPVYNYRVTILWGGFQGLPAGTELAGAVGTTTVISCSEVSGLTMEVDTVTYKHGFSFLTGFNIIPGQKKEVHLSIKKGVTKNGRYLSDWIKLVYPISMPAPLSLVRKRDILIDLCDEKGEPVVRWIVMKAMPVKLEAPSFDATTNDIAFENMEFIAHQLRVDYLNNDIFTTFDKTS